MNGIAVNSNWLYTYDSGTLKRWDKNSGAFIESRNVSASSPVFGNDGCGNSSIKIFWGGLSADECDNIYIGVMDTIKVYNTSLALINTIPLPDTVYDVKLGSANKLYACGKAFITQIDITPNNIVISISQTPPTSCSICDGTATAIISCGNPSDMQYSWNTSPVQTTQTATGLCSGDYSVTVTTNCMTSFTNTVTITGGSDLSATAVATPTTCNNNNGSATVSNVTGGASPYSFVWSPSGGTNSTATGLSSGTYTVTISDVNGCTKTEVLTIASSAPGPTATATSTVTPGQSITLNATGGGTYLWTPSTGLSCTNCVSPVASPWITTDYCVTVSDANNCTDSACVRVVPDIQCPVDDDFTVPNAFSPNNDGHNDLFILHGWKNCVSQFNIVIYDRWGEKVFETDDPAKSWDGTYKGKPLNAAVFVYSIKAKLFSGEELQKKGNISLIR